MVLSEELMSYEYLAKLLCESSDKNSIILILE